MKKYLLLILLFAFVQNIFAQKTATELSDLTEKDFDKLVNIYSGTEWRDVVKSGAQINPIKKVALISFSTFAPYGENNVFLPDLGTEYFANKLYSLNIEEIKKTFGEKNIELITVENMTETQKQFLTSNKWLSNLGEKQQEYETAYSELNENGNKVGSTAKGYINWTIEKGSPHQEELNVYALLAKVLEVDAVVVFSSLVTPGIDIYYNGTSITMIGSNPSNKEQGMYYSRVDMTAEIEMANTKKDVLIAEKYDGYDKIMRALVERMIKDLKTHTP